MQLICITCFKIIEKLDSIEHKLKAGPAYRGLDPMLKMLLDDIKDDQRRIRLSFIKPSLIGLNPQKAEQKLQQEWLAVNSELKTIITAEDQGIRGADFNRVKIVYDDEVKVIDVYIG